MYACCALCCARWQFAVCGGDDARTVALQDASSTRSSTPYVERHTSRRLLHTSKNNGRLRGNLSGLLKMLHINCVISCHIVGTAISVIDARHFTLFPADNLFTTFQFESLTNFEFVEDVAFLTEAAYLKTFYIALYKSAIFLLLHRNNTIIIQYNIRLFWVDKTQLNTRDTI